MEPARAVEPARPIEPPDMEGVDAAEWQSLLERGRQQGSVHAEQVTHVLRHVELTGDVLETVAYSLNQAGISLDETVDGEDVDELDDESDLPTAAQRLAQRDDEADEHLLSRRRRRRVRRTAPRTDGLTSDGVRMYLREIG